MTALIGFSPIESGISWRLSQRQSQLNSAQSDETELVGVHNPQLQPLHSEVGSERRMDPPASLSLSSPLYPGQTEHSSHVIVIRFPSSIRSKVWIRHQTTQSTDRARGVQSGIIMSDHE